MSARSQVGEDLQSIMAMIDAMQAIDTEGVEPLSHPLDASARLRADVVTESPDPEHFQQNAPAQVTTTTSSLASLNKAWLTDD